MRKQKFALVLMILCLVVLGCNFGELMGKKNEVRESNANLSVNSSNRASSNSSNRNSTDPPAESERIYKVMEDKANDLGRTKTTVKLDSKASIKGKVAVVAKKYEFTPDYEIEGFNVYKTDFDSEYSLDRYALTKERMAVKPEEIETLVHINCNQGKSIGRYTSPTGDKSVPAYSMVCKVSIIDYKTLTTVAQKTVENKTLEPKARIDTDDTKYVNLAPWDEIEKYLKSFPVS